MGPAAAEDSERSLPLDTLLEQAERRLILHALKLAAGNKTRAAEILSIWRPRLLRRMEALGIEDPEK
jgi:DNA-binding NtrC family response regulator